jgi:hypothetical protein
MCLILYSAISVLSLFLSARKQLVEVGEDGGKGKGDVGVIFKCFFLMFVRFLHFNSHSIQSRLLIQIF